jgi:hypothetical protein
MHESIAFSRNREAKSARGYFEGNRGRCGWITGARTSAFWSPIPIASSGLWCEVQFSLMTALGVWACLSERIVGQK